MFLLDPLPFSYDALEPYIDAQTMHLHHDKHHQTYVDKLNELVPQGGDLEKLIFSDNQKIKNMAGGVYNHNLFWKFLDPKNEKLKLDQKTIDEFTAKSLALFGSGWIWLTDKFEVLTTPNQDTPLITPPLSPNPLPLTPILCLDLWEHAYYLKYQNRRKDYLEAFWKLIAL